MAILIYEAKFKHLNRMRNSHPKEEKKRNRDKIPQESTKSRQLSKQTLKSSIAQVSGSRILGPLTPKERHVHLLQRVQIFF